MSRRKVLGRRQFLHLSAIAAGAVGLAACTQTPPPAPTKAAAEPTRAPATAAAAPTKAPEPAKPAAAAPTATTVPQTTKAPEPTKPAVAPSAPATVVPAAPAAEKPGKHLYGKLEGPEVITDPAKFPKEFKEAPQLAELVKAGKLPPVKERIGQDPLVIKPLAEIGKYGGLWRGGFTGPADFWNAGRTAAGPDHPLFWDYTGDKVVPNLAKGWDFADEGRTLILHLRRGMKWSDGKPFTADDFVFWFEDVYQNKDLNPTPQAAMMINGKPGLIDKANDYDVRFKFPDPYYMLPDVLAGATPIGGGQSIYAREGTGGYAPAHYMKQFHPKYVPADELDKKVKEAKIDNWANLFKLKNSWHLNPDLPVLSPWTTVSPANTPTWSLERNPYSIWVDTEGNQLPYIDKIVLTLAENLEIVNLRAVAGEFDYQSRHLTLANVPVFLENQQKGGYKLSLDPGDFGGDSIIKVNLSHQADAELAKWLTTTDFRRALSLGINRDQINETFYLGTGTPSSGVPADNNRYNPGPEYRNLWATNDVKQANELLDKIGLDKKDGEGFRLRGDGKGRLRLEIMSVGGQFLPFTQIGEMIKEQWKKIGIDARIQEVERSLAIQRAIANEQQMILWSNSGSEHLFTFPDNVFPYAVSTVATSGPLFAQWFQSAGAQGKEPMPRMRELMEKWKKAFGVPAEERTKLGKEVWKINAEEVFIIGVCGLSPADSGVRVAKVNLGNVPARQFNSPDTKTPGNSRPQTFFWKK